MEGWFPEDFVMPLLCESSEAEHRADGLEASCQLHTADCSVIANGYYTNLPLTTTQYVPSPDAAHSSVALCCNAIGPRGPRLASTKMSPLWIFIGAEGDGGSGDS